MGTGLAKGVFLKKKIEGVLVFLERKNWRGVRKTWEETRGTEVRCSFRFGGKGERDEAKGEKKRDFCIRGEKGDQWRKSSRKLLTPEKLQREVGLE